jgi:hypothetical protein
MTTLAKKVLDELERTDDLASFRIRRNKQGKKDDKDLIAPPTACFHGVGAQTSLPDGEGQPDRPEHEAVEAIANTGIADGIVQTGNGQNMFDDTFDDVFSTFLDPNYPTLDDLSFMEDLTPFDWNVEIAVGS